MEEEILLRVLFTFQFLIGTLKTEENMRGVVVCIKEFQFLIGTLKTKLISEKDISFTLVSIPYRHAKNPSK